MNWVVVDNPSNFNNNITAYSGQFVTNFICGNIVVTKEILESLKNEFQTKLSQISVAPALDIATKEILKSLKSDFFNQSSYYTSNQHTFCQ